MVLINRMKKLKMLYQPKQLVATLFFFVIFCQPVLCDPDPVKLHVKDKHVIIENGFMKLTLSNPGGFVSEIAYNGIDNLLNHRYQESNRGYWDLIWSEGAGKDKAMYRIEGVKLKVAAEEDDYVEVSFTTPIWTSKRQGKSVPLNIDKRYVVVRGVSGFYTYAIFDHLDDWPGFHLNEARIAFKLREDKFRLMAVTDERQRIMPTIEDRRRGKRLDYPEAVLLTHTSDHDLEGEVDDKYQYSTNNKDNKVHGWISTNPPTGFWQITPSDEFRTGGPMKQSLTSHAYPISLATFVSAHYAGIDLLPKIEDNEAWKKVLGPIFIYLNSGGNPKSLWEDAKQQMESEVKKWPYDFIASSDFPKSNERGSVSGRLLVKDWYVSRSSIPANAAYVGLAAPGHAGSWQIESKGYQFWTEADSNGNFKINNVRAGDYDLYAFVPGFIGDYKYGERISIRGGSIVALGDIVYTPPRNGPTLWEIGIPDRTAKEFYVPDPNPKYVNKLYLTFDKFRQYGLWERYTDLYPNKDLVYTVGESNYTQDWFYAHVTRRVTDELFEPTTWQIKFELEDVKYYGGTYVLRIALASASFAHLRVQINGNRGYFATPRVGRDNAIARHGIHGLYWLFEFRLPGMMFVRGTNTISLTQVNGGGRFPGLMYDYIRLEGPRN